MGLREEIRTVALMFADPENQPPQHPIEALPKLLDDALDRHIEGGTPTVRCDFRLGGLLEFAIQYDA